MGRLMKALIIMGMLAGLTLHATGAEEKKIQFAPTAGVFFGDEWEIGAVFGGVGVRVDFNLLKTIMISPELLALFFGYFGPFLPSCTISYNFGKVFAGLGVAAITAFEYPAMAKVQVGMKSRHWTLAGSLLTGGGMTLAGLTIGYIF